MGRSAIPVGPAGAAVSAGVVRRRRAEGLTQSEVTDLVNTTTEHRIPKQALTEMETMRRRVDVDDLVSLAQVLHTTPHELLEWPEAGSVEQP